MTRDDIIRMAQEAGWEPIGENPKTEFTFFLNNLERFAELVAAAEREACARILDGVNNYDNPMTAADCADAIRARGQ